AAGPDRVAAPRRQVPTNIAMFVANKVAFAPGVARHARARSSSKAMPVGQRLRMTGLFDLAVELFDQAGAALGMAEKARQLPCGFPDRIETLGRRQIDD